MLVFLFPLRRFRLSERIRPGRGRKRTEFLLNGAQADGPWGRASNRHTVGDYWRSASAFPRPAVASLFTYSTW